jgi:hypothetical protein
MGSHQPRQLLPSSLCSNIKLTRIVFAAAPIVKNMLCTLFEFCILLVANVAFWMQTAALYAYVAQ